MKADELPGTSRLSHSHRSVAGGLHWPDRCYLQRSALFVWSKVTQTEKDQSGPGVAFESLLLPRFIIVSLSFISPFVALKTGCQTNTEDLNTTKQALIKPSKWTF